MTDRDDFMRMLAGMAIMTIKGDVKLEFMPKPKSRWSRKYIYPSLTFHFNDDGKLVAYTHAEGIGAS